MMKKYFIVNISDMTQNILDKSCGNNPYDLRKSADGTKVVVKCDCSNVPVEFLKLGLTQMTQEDVHSYCYDSDWISDLSLSVE